MGGMYGGGAYGNVDSPFLQQAEVSVEIDCVGEVFYALCVH